MPAMSFLQKHPKTGVYRIRRRIPGRAQAAFGGKAEILESLGTKDVAEAKRLALPRLAQIQDKIDRAMAGAIHWQTHELGRAENEFFVWLGDAPVAVGCPAVFPSRDNFQGNLARFVKVRYPQMSAPDVDELRRYIETEAESRPVPLYPSAARPPEPKTAKRIKLSDLEKLQLLQKDYTERTREDVRKAYAHLRELHGDCDIRTITSDAIREWRDLLLKYPVVGRTKDLKLREAAKQTWERTTNPKTVAKLLGFIRQGFRLAVSEGLAELNPTRDIVVPKKTGTSKDAPREEFSKDQLEKLFTSPLFTGCRNEGRLWMPGNVAIRDYRYWVPWIALYTGARLSEIIALEKADLKQDDGIWYYNFTDHATDKSLVGQKRKKTKFSIRDVPLHPGLIDLGFVEWAQKQPDGLLLPSHYKKLSVYARVYSNSFRAYLKKIGITGVSMHGFRHGFGTACRMAGLEEEDHNRLAGRSQKGVSWVYGKHQRKIATLKELIDRLKFPGVPRAPT